MMHARVPSIPSLRVPISAQEWRVPNLKGIAIVTQVSTGMGNNSELRLHLLWSIILENKTQCEN